LPGQGLYVTVVGVLVIPPDLQTLRLLLVQSEEG